MRSAGAVYRQYKYARKLALIRALSAARDRKHDNCFYGKAIEYRDLQGHEKVIRLCMYKPNDPDVCTNPAQCNAFANKWSDEDVFSKFQAILSDDTLKKQAFPELWAYEWVLDKSVSEAKKTPRGFMEHVLVWLILALEALLRTVCGKREIINGGQDAKA